VSAQKALLRMARRDARRSKARSLLVVAMIALPVVGVTAADVLYRSFQLSPDQKATRSLGRALGWVYDTAVVPAPQQRDNVQHVPRVGPAPPLGKLVPAGTVVTEDSATDGLVTFGARTVRTTVRDVDYANPAVAGIFFQDSGRSPHAGQVALTRALARRLGAGVGDAVTVRGQSATVSGIVHSADGPAKVLAVVAPGSLKRLPDRYLVTRASSLTWTDVTRLNAAGFVLNARHHLAGQPPTPNPRSSSATGSSKLTAIALIVGMALLEIVLLAGPAFAVGAKRQSRELALLAASGADRGHVRQSVLLGGLLLGAVGGLVGVLGGIGLAAAGEPRVQQLTSSYPGPFELRPLEILGIAAVGVTTAFLAAVMPARAVSRQDVVAALTGRRGQVRSLRRTPVIGAIAAVAGAALALRGAQHRSINTILAGSAFAELGLVATTPFLVGLAGRTGRFLPLGPRLAVRDAARNRGRTAPAVSAVLAAVAGSVAVGTYVASLDRYNERNYQRLAPIGTATVPVDGHAPAASIQRLQQLVARDLPGTHTQLIRTPVVYLEVKASSIGVCAYASNRTPEALRRAEQDPLCNGHALNAGLTNVAVGGPGDLQALTGLADRGQAEVLTRGGAVVPLNLYEPGRGTATFVSHPTNGAVQRSFTVPAVPLPREAIQVTVLSARAAATHHVALQPAGVIARGATAPTQEQEDRLRSGLSGLGLDSPLIVERGYQTKNTFGMLALLLGSAVIVLGASGIATGLAAADGKADLATLAAVGASPRTRRTLAAFQSAVTAGLGTALGIAAGLVPAVGMVRALNAAARQARFPRFDPYPLVLPWTNLLVTAVVVPLIAAGAAALLTRSRLPMVRRIG
jgi:putative ABC transport system permease protein